MWHTNSRAQILLLIGQDLPEAHHVGDQRIGTRQCTLCSTSEPGLVVVGEVCLENFHKPTTVASFNTKLIDLHRETIFKPCSNKFQLKKRHFKVLIKKPMYIIFKRMIMRLDSPQTLESLLIWWSNIFRKIAMDVGKHLFHSEIRARYYQTIEFKHINMLQCFMWTCRKIPQKGAFCDIYSWRISLKVMQWK